MTSSDIASIKDQLDPVAKILINHFEDVTQELRSVIQSLNEQIKDLREQNEELRRMLFGSRSEKMPSIASEIRRQVEEKELFPPPSDDDPKEPAPRLTDEEKEKRKRQRARKKSEPKRKTKRKLRKNLPVIHERVEVSPEKLPEGYNLEDFREVGGGKKEEDSANVVRRVEHVREHLVVKEYHLQTLASKDKQVIVTAEAPAAVVEGGHYGPGVYAHVIENKCLNSLPLYRISKMLDRAGCPIARSTLCDMYHRSSVILRRIYNRLVELSQQQPYLNADETKLRYLSKGHCKTGWIWTLVSKVAIVYMFSLSRSAKFAEKLLGGTSGKLQIDGYAAYNEVCKKDDAKNEKGRERIGCWAHCRRGFFKAQKNYPEAKEMLDLILELYKVEYHAAEKGILETEEHLALRQDQSAGILIKMKEWLDEKKGHFPPKSAMGKAITYANNQWSTLIAFKDDPLLRLDNNYAENALRIIALGRKNFLFTANELCGQNLAVLQSIVATCLLHGVKPYDYLKDVLIRVQDHPTDRIDELLPQNWAPLSSHSA